MYRACTTVCIHTVINGGCIGIVMCMAGSVLLPAAVTYHIHVARIPPQGRMSMAYLRSRIDYYSWLVCIYMGRDGRPLTRSCRRTAYVTIVHMRYERTAFMRLCRTNMSQCSHFVTLQLWQRCPVGHRRSHCGAGAGSQDAAVARAPFDVDMAAKR